MDWNDVAVITVLYQLFLGTRNSKDNIKPEFRRAPACTRLRLKLFTYLIRSREASMHFPSCIQVTNSKYGAVCRLMIHSPFCTVDVRRAFWREFQCQTEGYGAAIPSSNDFKVSCVDEATG